MTGVAFCAFFVIPAEAGIQKSRTSTILRHFAQGFTDKGLTEPLCATGVANTFDGLWPRRGARLRLRRSEL